jgi:hypothetical protein
MLTMQTLCDRLCATKGAGRTGWLHPDDAERVEHLVWCFSEGLVA